MPNIRAILAKINLAIKPHSMVIIWLEVRTTSYTWALQLTLWEKIELEVIHVLIKTILRGLTLDFSRMRDDL